jgi:hypothetical protein
MMNRRVFSQVLSGAVLATGGFAARKFNLQVGHTGRVSFRA